MFLGREVFVLHHFPRRALIALATAVAVAALAPIASASINPTVALTQSTTTAGATGATLGLDIKFQPSAGDTPKDITIALPPGLLDDASIDGGACLTQATAVAACLVTTSTSVATVGGAANVPLAMYLAKPPTAGDAAGLLLQIGGTTVETGDIIVRPATDPLGVGLSLKFSSLPSAPPVSEMNAAFTGIRLPAKCAAASVALTADSQLAPSTPVTATASPALSVQNCASLPYNPQIVGTATKDTTDTNAAVTTVVTQAAHEATSGSVAITIPKNLAPNTGALSLICASNATYSNCTKVGVALARTPLLPVPLIGNVYLTSGPSLFAPNMTVVFSSPFQLVLNGSVGIASNSVTFSSVPDFPLTQLVVALAGGPNALFSPSCNPVSSPVTAKFTSQNGDQTKIPSSLLTIKGCPTTAPPPATATAPTLGAASLTGLATGQGRLKFTLTKGKNGAPKLGSVSINAPSGLSFVKSQLKKGVAVSGGKIKSVSLRGGKLVVMLTSAVANVTVKVSPSAMKVSSSLRSRVKKHKTKKLKLSVTVGLANGTSKALSSTLSVH